MAEINYTELTGAQKEIYQFLKNHIYPKFYKESESISYIVGEYDEKMPVYGVKNEKLEMIFLADTEVADDVAWEVALKIKDHEFCDVRIREFRKWYREKYSYHNRDRKKFLTAILKIPKEYRSSVLDLYDQEEEKDFMMSFTGKGAQEKFLIFMNIFKTF